MSHSMRWLTSWLNVWLLVFTGIAADAAEDVSTVLAGHLQQGRLAEAEVFLEQRLTDNPQRSQLRFALGVVHVLQAIEDLGQEQYRYGALNSVRNVPVLRLPLPANPHPEEVTYAQVRDVFQNFQTRILRAEAELAKVDVQQDVRLPIDLLEIRLDLTGDGTSDKAESFLRIVGVVNRAAAGAAKPDLRVTFDAGDVPWLRGYCHFLAGFCDVVLAYDHQELFDHCGQLVYPRHVASKSPVVGELGAATPRFEVQIVDVIAAIHLVNLPLKEPQRLTSARNHFLEMIRTSRESWELILKETDNDREWLPNPQQTGILRIPVTADMIDGWHKVLLEMEDLLEGRKLIPFWRDYFGFFGPNREIPAEGRGVNLKRWFEEPREFDLILTIQGTNVLPYVEDGPLSRPETWTALGRVFQGQFFGFALWFN